MVYEGKVWQTHLPISEMHLQPDSRVFLMGDPNCRWPQGPVRPLVWTWEECDETMLCRHLCNLLEDHASPLDFVLEGLDVLVQRLAVPEEEWDGALAPLTLSCSRIHEHTTNCAWPLLCRPRHGDSANVKSPSYALSIDREGVVPLHWYSASGFVRKAPGCSC